jgi:DNA-binding MarR family transcriptional regulator
LTDDDVLEKALGARNAGKFARLWAADLDGYPSHSEADLALCAALAFWTQDAEQIDRLFRRSGLYREKWERADYREHTIAQALNRSEHWISAHDHHTSEIGDETPSGLTLEDVVKAFRKWLDLPDPGFLEILLASYVANLIPGDPVWLLGVGPSSGGKTEPLLAMLGLPKMVLVSTLSEGALLSGTPKREKDKSSTGGLLRQIGDFGFLICKDFTSVLSMQDKIRSTTLAALREIYDGSWERPLGIDGGRVLPWKGKVAILAGCTDVIDSHHVLMTAMGQRFFMFRLPRIDAHAQAEKAFDSNAKEIEMRGELQAIVTRFFKGRRFDRVDPTAAPKAMREHLIQLAMLTVVARSPIERDPRKRDITLIPDPEAPARATKAIGKLWAALRAIGVPDQRAWQLVRKVGLDSMPKLRQAILRTLAVAPEPKTTADVAIALSYPTQTTRRALEDLAGHKLIQRAKVEGKRGDFWSLTDETKARFDAVPKIIENKDFIEE